MAWSSEPSPTYTKQEYLPEGQTPDHYTDMLLVERLVSDLDVAKAAQQQVATLEARKAKDPVVNYQILQNPDHSEIILDFVLSDHLPDGTVVVEWNAYRYASVPTPGGQPAMLLFGVSHRGYGDQAKAFMQGLGDRRNSEIAALAQAALPQPAK